MAAIRLTKPFGKASQGAPYYGWAPGPGCRSKIPSTLRPGCGCSLRDRRYETLKRGLARRVGSPATPVSEEKLGVGKLGKLNWRDSGTEMGKSGKKFHFPGSKPAALYPLMQKTKRAQARALPVGLSFSSYRGSLNMRLPGYPFTLRVDERGD